MLNFGLNPTLFHYLLQFGLKLFVPFFLLLLVDNVKGKLQITGFSLSSPAKLFSRSFEANQQIEKEVHVTGHRESRLVDSYDLAFFIPREVGEKFNRSEGPH